MLACLLACLHLFPRPRLDEIVSYFPQQRAVETSQGKLVHTVFQSQAIGVQKKPSTTKSTMGSHHTTPINSTSSAPSPRPRPRPPVRQAPPIQQPPPIQPPATFPPPPPRRPFDPAIPPLLHTCSATHCAVLLFAPASAKGRGGALCTQHGHDLWASCKRLHEGWYVLGRTARGCSPVRWVVGTVEEEGGKFSSGEGRWMLAGEGNLRGGRVSE